MRRSVAALSACLSLAACAPQLSLLRLPGGDTSKPAVPPSQASPICPGSLMADPSPEPPLPSHAGFPAPTDAQASASVTAYLTWLHQLALWGRQGWAVAKTAHDFCTSSVPR